MKLSNQPPKGTSDWLPEEFKIRKYIFDTWRKVCISFGYQEYLTPIVESAEIYRAKSGEDVGGKELMFFNDKAGRELAIRPEMTPSVTRMVSKIYNESPKPLKFFSIANFFRNEKPQRGRNREFWQLNYDIFGANSLEADTEIIQIAIEIMLGLGAKKGQFKIFINNRNFLKQFIKSYLGIGEQINKAVRILDKFEKVPLQKTIEDLENAGANCKDYGLLSDFMAGRNLEEIKKYQSERKEANEIEKLLDLLKELGYSDYVKWKPGLSRGFDYYDGMVFEVFDTNPNNARSLFGGGRYNGLAELFGGSSFPAVGAAPGDETIRLFLKSWGLEEQILKNLGTKTKSYFIPVLSEELYLDVQSIAKKLRKEGAVVEIGLELSKLGKALEYANKRKFDFVVIMGSEEKSRGEYKIKNMQSGEEISSKL